MTTTMTLKTLTMMMVMMRTEIMISTVITTTNTIIITTCDGDGGVRGIVMVMALVMMTVMTVTY